MWAPARVCVWGRESIGLNALINFRIQLPGLPRVINCWRRRLPVSFACPHRLVACAKTPEAEAFRLRSLSWLWYRRDRQQLRRVCMPPSQYAHVTHDKPRWDLNPNEATRVMRSRKRDRGKKIIAYESDSLPGINENWNLKNSSVLQISPKKLRRLVRKSFGG